ncbi:MFS transporter [Arthrobacter sp. ZGTC412]|uniref:MFS transporter n=1 Tax=Arthrobacter sp. ZGTC412 TaxID=2058900 RepID=UPI0021574712|nr:MFS transporter [Arthrobacter sp. ZGTC412]
MSRAIADEDAQHTTAHGGKINRWKMLPNPQILLLCGIYFSVQLSIYANTFWLPSIIKQIPGTTDLTVGFLSSIPWICAVFAMYFAAKWQDKAKSKRPLLVIALLVAAVGTFAAAIASPVMALVFLAIAAMGFKSASPLFWTNPQSETALRQLSAGAPWVTRRISQPSTQCAILPATSHGKRTTACLRWKECRPFHVPS